MSKKKKLTEEDYLNMTTTASANETMGMMPTLPRSGEEFEALQDLAGLSVPKERKKDH